MDLPARGLAWAAAAALLACSPPPPEPSLDGRSLLELDAWRRVEEERADAPVRETLVTPRRPRDGIFETLPALELAPPARVCFDLPELDEELELELAWAFARPRAGAGEVRFRASWRGEAAVDEVRSGDAPRSELGWHEARVDLGTGGGTLVLEATPRAGAGASTRVAFARLLLRGRAPRPTTVASARAPSVLFVVVDTLRADRLGAYGYAPARTPAIDSLAARGTLYERAYASAPWTSPSTASLLTGLAPPEHGVGLDAGQFLAFELRTLAESLRAAGIATAGFSCNPLVSRSRNFDQGFEHFREYPWSLELAEGRGDAPAARAVDDALAWLEAWGSGRFFLYLQIMEPHDPYTPDADLLAHYVGGEAEMGEFHSIDQEVLESPPGEHAPLARQVPRWSALYDAEVATVDRQIGRLLEHLERAGLAETTVVVLTSDHGEEFLEHGLVGHRHQCHRETLHVPLVLAGPGVPEGERVPERVANRELAGTLLRLARVDCAELATGRDLLDPAQAEREIVFATTRGGRLWDGEAGEWRLAGVLHAARTDRWHFTWAPEPQDGAAEVVQLFDLEADPKARIDVSARYPEVAELLRELTLEWLARGGGDSGALRDAAQEQELLRALGYGGPTGG